MPLTEEQQAAWKANREILHQLPIEYKLIHGQHYDTHPDTGYTTWNMVITPFEFDAIVDHLFTLSMTQYIVNIYTRLTTDPQYAESALDLWQDLMQPIFFSWVQTHWNRLRNKFLTTDTEPDADARILALRRSLKSAKTTAQRILNDDISLTPAGARSERGFESTLKSTLTYHPTRRINETRVRENNQKRWSVNNGGRAPATTYADHLKALAGLPLEVGDTVTNGSEGMGVTTDTDWIPAMPDWQ